MIRFKEKKKDRISVIENSIDNILDSLKNLTDTQKDIIYQEEDGKKTPITQKIIQPKIEGAIITAQGANNATVKTNVIQAVEAVTGLATHKIQVFEMN